MMLHEPPPLPPKMLKYIPLHRWLNHRRLDKYWRKMAEWRQATGARGNIAVRWLIWTEHTDGWVLNLVMADDEQTLANMRRRWESRGFSVRTSMLWAEAPGPTPDKPRVRRWVVWMKGKGDWHLSDIMIEHQYEVANVRKVLDGNGLKVKVREIWVKEP